MAVFDPENIGFRSFVLEASAGTGKTYNLVLIYLSWILDQGKSVDKIPVLTFTEDAAGEMRTRISTNLREVLKDPGLRATQDALSILRLTRAQRALEDLSQAPIGTIHSFCLTFLTKYSLELGLRYPLKMGPKDMLSQLFQEYLLVHPLPWDLGKLLDWKGSRQTLERQLFELVENGWGDPSRGPFFPSVALLEKIKKLDAPTSQKDFGFWDSLATDFGDEILPEGYKTQRKKLDTQRDADLAVQKSWRSLQFLSEAWAYLQGFHTYYKKKGPGEGQVSFNDMISLVSDSLNTRGMAQEIFRRSYQGIIVDEFQDTDRQQWNIIKKGFLDINKPVILIGDPKQSIYMFRGGEPRVYLQAKREVQNRTPDQVAVFQLGENFRSSSGIVQGANQIFRRVFGDTPTGFHDSQVPGKDKKKVPPAWVESDRPSVEVLEHGGTGLNKEIWNALVVRHLSELMKTPPLFIPGHTEGETPAPRALTWGDIAILVEGHGLGRDIYQELKSLGIPARKNKGVNIFITQEMDCLLSWLGCLENPQDTSLLGQFLLGPLFQMDWQSWRYLKDQELLGGVKLALVKGQGAFIEGGIGCFWSVVQEIYLSLKSCGWSDGLPQGTPLEEGLFNQSGGERVHKNYSQILEVVAAQPNLNTPQKVLRFLDQEKKEGKEDENPLHLEKEGQTVNIMTIHASKGLEFPVVYFTGSSDNAKSRGFGYFDQDQATGKDFWAESEATKAANKNIIGAEKDRLYYVAFTRAQLQVIMPHTGTTGFWQNFMRKAFGATPEERKDNFVLWGWKTKTLDLEAPPAQVSIPKSPLQKMEYFDPDQVVLTAPQEYFTSYSGLVKAQGKKHLTTLEAWEDETPSIPLLPVAEEPILPRGAKFGDFFHNLLENLDFSLWEGDTALLEAHWEEVLALSTRLFWPTKGVGSDPKGGMTPQAKAEVRRLVDQLMTQEIPLVEKGFTLSHLQPKDKRPELEFHLRTQETNLKVMEYPDIQVHCGYLKGFIDLVFQWKGRLYFLDWKTNDLGPGPYTGAQIRESMADHQYFLQGRIYLTALYQWLQTTGNQNLTIGGGLYIYLRGLGTGPQEEPSTPGLTQEIPGIHWFPPDTQTLELWAKNLISGALT